MFVLLWLIALAVPILSFAATFQKSYPMKVAATVGMVADIVKEVAGDKAALKNIIGSGIDPHVYNPTRGDVAILLKSDIIFYAGLLLEGQMSDVLVKVSRKRPAYAVTELLKKDYLIHDNQTNHHDPHVWMDVQGWMKAVDVVADALTAFDPPNKEYYDIEVLGIQGISTESEAGIKDINRIVDVLVTRRIPAVFVESSVSDKNVKALIEGAASRGHQVRIGGELFSDAMGPPGSYEGTYIGMIDHNITIITRALSGTVPKRGMQDKLTISQK
jgi:manganese/zinc/iron transport system substrate-binding protein